MNKDVWFHVVAVAGGVFMWILVSLAAGRKEAREEEDLLHVVAKEKERCGIKHLY
jgi:hypothetical protein